MAVHGHPQRTEIADAKAPEALRIQVIEIDIFQAQPACGSPTPYLTAYTSVGIR